MQVLGLRVVDTETSEREGGMEGGADTGLHVVDTGTSEQEGGR